MAKSNVTQIRKRPPAKALPSHETLEQRMDDMQKRLWRLQNILGVTRARLADIAECTEGPGQRATEDCSGTLEICLEMVDGIGDILDHLCDAEVEAQS